MFGAGISVGASGIGPQGAIGSQGASSAAGAQGNQGFQGIQGAGGALILGSVFHAIVERTKLSKTNPANGLF